MPGRPTVADLPRHPPVAPPIAPPPIIVGPPAGWYPDPWRAAPTRWWDGGTWTAHVWYAVPVTPVAEAPLSPLPLRAGLVVLGVLAVSLGVQRVTVSHLQDHHVPLMLLLAVSVTLAYVPALVASLAVARRFAADAGPPLRALAFRVRGADIGWGLVTWLAIIVGNRVLVTFINVTGLPLTSNVRAGPSSPARNLLIASTLVAVVAAPLVEELIFRGVVLRALRSVMPTSVAIGVQAVCFGLAHVQASFGVGNLGLVLLLSWAGVGLGFVAHHFRRLGPSICAHASVNGVVFLVIWLAPQLLRQG